MTLRNIKEIQKDKITNSFSSHFIMYDHEQRERANNAAVYRVLKKKGDKLKKEKIALSYTIPLEIKPSKINNNNNNNHSSSRNNGLPLKAEDDC